MIIEVISLIYKSVQYLDFISQQLDKYCHDFENVKVVWRIMANDPTPEILLKLKNSSFDYSIFNNDNPHEYYINRVYRCYNYCVETSKADCVILVNSDMAFSENWIKPLYEAHQNGFLPTSRLVESGKLSSGQHAYSYNLGTHPNNFKENDWVKFQSNFRENRYLMGGLYMPVFFDRLEFLLAGKYPNGNIYQNGNFVMSGDAAFFKHFSSLTNRKHITCFDSLVYHIQEGEKDE